MSLKYYISHKKLLFLWKLQLIVAFSIYCYSILGSFPSQININSSDKVLHFVGNFLLYSSFWLASLNRVKPLSLFIALIPFVALMEFAQHFNASRQVDVMDMIANILGLSCGFILCSFTQKVAKL